MRLLNWKRYWLNYGKSRSGKENGGQKATNAKEPVVKEAPVLNQNLLQRKLK